MILISVTRLRVRSHFLLPQFLWHTFKSTRQVERADGFLGGRVLTNPRKVFWTLTAWENDAAMNSIAPMPRIAPQCPNCCTGATKQPSFTGRRKRPICPPGKRASAHGDVRPRSKVNHPSPAQTANQFPAPVPSRIESILKPRK